MLPFLHYKFYIVLYSFKMMSFILELVHLSLQIGHMHHCNSFYEMEEKVPP